MNSILKELEEYRNLWIQSKIKFHWNFHKILEELVWELEVSISKEIIPNYWIVYTSYWTQIIKIKMKDKNLMTEKLISCNLFHSKNDKTYWYVTPIFASAEKSQKTKRHELPKFSLSNKGDIVKAITAKLLDIIEEF